MTDKLKRPILLLLLLAVFASTVAYPLAIPAPMAVRADYADDDTVLDWIFNTAKTYYPTQLANWISDEIQSNNGFSPEVALNLGKKYVDNLEVSSDAFFNSLQNTANATGSWFDTQRDKINAFYNAVINGDVSLEAEFNSPLFSAKWGINMAPVYNAYYSNSNVQVMSPGVQVIRYSDLKSLMWPWIFRYNIIGQTLSYPSISNINCRYFYFYHYLASLLTTDGMFRTKLAYGFFYTEPSTNFLSSANGFKLMFIDSSGAAIKLPMYERSYLSNGGSDYSFTNYYDYYLPNTYTGGYTEIPYRPFSGGSNNTMDIVFDSVFYVLWDGELQTPPTTEEINYYITNYVTNVTNNYYPEPSPSPSPPPGEPTPTPDVDINVIASNWAGSEVADALTLYVHAEPGKSVIAVVTTKSATSFSNGWSVLSEVHDTTSGEHNLYVLGKTAESETETLSVTQAEQTRLYIELLSFDAHVILSELAKSYTPPYNPTVSMPDKPNGAKVLYALSSNVWAASSPYGKWQTSPDDIARYSAPSDVPDYQAAFYDDGAGAASGRTFTANSSIAGIASIMLKVTASGSPPYTPPGGGDNSGYWHELFTILYQIKAAVEAVPSSIVSALVECFSTLTSAMYTMNNELLHAINGITSGGGDSGGGFWDAIAEIAKAIASVVSSITNLGTSVVDGITSLGTGLIEGINEIIDRLIENMFDLIDKIIDKFYDLFVMLFVPDPDELTSIFDEFKGKVDNEVPVIGELINIHSELDMFMSSYIDSQDTVTLSAESFEVNSFQSEGVSSRGFEPGTVYGPPTFMVTMPEAFGGGEYNVIDLSFYADYREYVHNLITAFLSFFALKRFFSKVTDKI